MRLYFARHGESTANLLREFANSGFKHPLTENGVKQARTLALAFAGKRIDQIYSSPVMRAVQTAQILAETLGAPAEITEALREWDVGIYEGTTDPVGWELHRQVQEDWFVHNKLDSRMPGSESFLDIWQRFAPFVNQLVHTHGHTDHSTILVAHGGLYIAMLPAILKNVDKSLASRNYYPYTSCVVAETRPDGLSFVEWI